MADNIFLLHGEDQLVQMESQPYDSEALLQTLLAKFPDLLAGGQIDSESPRQWLLIKREMGIPDEDKAGDRWSVDHLFLDQDAIPTLVEVKRSSNTDIRRKVVGQMLDYAANAVVHWPVEQIRAVFENSHPDADLRLAEFLSDDSDPEEFWQKVKINLQAGKIRMLFVADVIPVQLRRIIEFLNEQMDPAEVLGVEIKQYIGEDMKTLVPRVIGQTAEAERKKTQATTKWPDWDSGLAEVSNSPLVSYFKQQIEQGRECSLTQRTLSFKVNGKVRWRLNVKHAHGGFSGASQNGRFHGDVEFWRKGLGKLSHVRLVSNDSRLNFRLFSDKDFSFFHQAVTDKLQAVKWKDGEWERTTT